MKRPEFNPDIFYAIAIPVVFVVMVVGFVNLVTYFFGG